MKVPLTIRDHLDRARLVYGDRLAVVDEPDQPATPLEGVTYRRLHELAAAQAARLDELGVGRGERVAIVSRNSARLPGRLLRHQRVGPDLRADQLPALGREIDYIVGHCGASVLLVDPELDEALARHQGRAPVRARRRRRAGAPLRREPEPVGGNRTRTPQRRSTTRRAPRPAQRRADDPSQPLDQRRHLRAGNRGQRPGRLPAHPADVPLQRLGDALRASPEWAAPRGAAQGRRRRDPAAGRAGRA